MVELSASHPGVRNGACRVGIRDDAPGLLGDEEEGLVALLVDFGNPHGAADGASEIVVAKLGTRSDRRGGVVEEAVGIQIVIAEELL